MASIGSLNATPLTMRLATKPARRLSIAFDSVREPSRNPFHRCDRDTLSNELAEVFSLIESVELVNGRRIIQKMGWEGIYARISDSNSIPNSVLELLLHELKHPDQNRRISATTLLCVFMIGMAGAESRSEAEKIQDASSIAQVLIHLGLLLDIVQCLCRSASYMAKLQLSENNPQSMDVFYSTSRELRLCLSIVSICIILLPGNPQVKHMLSADMFDGKNIIVFCLDIIASDNAELFPLKKLFIIVRHALLHYGCGINTSDFGENYLKKIKSRRRDVFQISKHIAEQFGPILCIPNSAHVNGIELVTFSRTPTALKQQIEAAREFLHDGYSDSDHITAEQFHQSDVPDFADDIQLYRILYPRLREYVVAALKIFLSMAPNVRPSAQITNSFRELQISASIPDLSNTVERARHTEIVTKNISFMFLSLLKAFRKGHPLQFTTLLCLLQDKNCLILILKFLNQNLSLSLFKRNEIPSLSIFGCIMPSLDEAAIIGLILESKGSLSEACWRKYSAYISMLRLLQKLTKNAPRQIRSMVKFRAPEILTRLLEIPQSDIIIYTLKLLKSQIAFTDGKWRSENIDIISAVFLHVRMDLLDNWLEPRSSNDAALDAENSVAKSVRQHCHIFNSQMNRSDHKSLLNQLSDNASEAEILTAALAEHPQCLSQDFIRGWKKWLQHEGLASGKIA